MSNKLLEELKESNNKHYIQQIHKFIKEVRNYIGDDSRFEIDFSQYGISFDLIHFNSESYQKGDLGAIKYYFMENKQYNLEFEFDPKIENYSFYEKFIMSLSYGKKNKINKKMITHLFFYEIIKRHENFIETLKLLRFLYPLKDLPKGNDMNKIKANKETVSFYV